jgi:hypothetical protein
MKKILSLALALVMVFGLLPMAFAAEEPTAEVSQYQEFIDFLKLPGINIYHGTAADEDGADEDVTRWQMALFVSRLVTGETEDDYWKTNVNDSGFTDVEKFEGSSEATLGAISFASQKGIVNGIGDGLFDPTADVTYQDAIVMIVRALGYNYKSSGYPWSYINKARELGVLEGISGIGYTQAAPRGVVAVLLYNAFFAQTEDGTVAEKVFGVGSGIVMITASNAVYYEPDGNTVARSNYVQFKFLEDGVLTGAAYHLPASKFGLAAGDETNAAVGTTFFVYYGKGVSDVIYAKPLSKTYTNTPAEQQFTYSNSNLKFDNGSYRVVPNFTSLNNVAGSYTGANEIKVFQGFGGTVTTPNRGHTQYLVAANGSIYDVTYSITDPIVYYNAVLDIYYEKDSAGGFNILSYDKVYSKYIANSTTTDGSFKQLTGGQISPALYSKIVVSDASLDGTRKLATIRNYRLGRFTFENKYDRYKNKNGDNISHAVKPTFYIFEGQPYNDDTKAIWGLAHVQNYTNFASVSQSSKLNGNWVANSAGAAPRYVEDYRFTGLNKQSGTFWCLYYLDEQNYEVDILKVFDLATPGYVKGYDVLNNKLTIDGVAYSYGYNNLPGSSVVTKDYGGSNKFLENNLTKVNELAGQYVDYLMVDDKIVWIGTKGGTSDYIIADKIVSYDTDGITVGAYTTVDDTYKEIKINEFNGWQLGSYDANYYFYYLAGLISGANQNISTPINLNQIYSVKYIKDGKYNLTFAPAGTDATFTIYDSGLMTGTNGSGKLGASQYTTVTASDYWLILIPEHYELDDTGAYVLNTNGDRVITAAQIASYKGKLGATVINGVDCVKCTSTDYVLQAQVENVDPDTGIGTLVNPDLLNDLKAVTMTNVKYMVYASSAFSTQYQYVYSASQAIGYSVYMTNIQDASSAVVTWNPYDATIAYSIPANVVPVNGSTGLEPGAIYMVVDGVVVGKYVGTLDQLATTKFKTSGDLEVGVENITAFTLNDVRDVAAKRIAVLCAGIDDSSSAYTSYYQGQRGKVNTYGITQPYTNNFQVVKNNVSGIPTDGGMWTVAYIIHANGTADAWIVPGELTSTATATVTAYKAGTDDLDSTDVAVSATKNNESGKYTVEITLPTTGAPMIAYDAATDTAITVTADSGAVTAINYATSYVKSIKVEAITGSSVTVTIANRASGNDITITVTIG